MAAPTGKFRAFLAHYGADAALDGKKAAGLAGYANPGKAWVQIRRRWPKELQAVEMQFKEHLQMEWAEVASGIADVARTPRHKDRLKALELLARIHGKLDPKLAITLDRTTIEQHLEELLLQMATNKAELADGAAVPQLAATALPGNPPK